MNNEKKTFVKIDDWGEVEITYLVDTVRNLKSYGTWTLEKRRRTPALIDKNGRTSRQYVGQNYDPKYIDLVSDGWTHDHCEICTKTISDRDDIEDWVTQGYRADNRWICEECFNLFMVTDNIDVELEKYPREEK